MTSVNITSFVTNLYSEGSLLRRILYRNEKQHGKTRIFTYLKGVWRPLHRMTKSRLLLVIDKATETLHLTSLSQRVAESNLALEIASLRGVDLAVKALVVAARKGHCALLCLTAQLRKRVFTPIFSMLAALTSRMLRCLRELLKSLMETHQTLRDRLTFSLPTLDNQEHHRVVAGLVREALRLMPSHDDLQISFLKASKEDSPRNSTATDEDSDGDKKVSEVDIREMDDDEMDDDIGESVNLPR
eukprot:gene7580-8381_t